MIRLGVSMDTLELGGLELSTLDLLSRLDGSQFEPHVYAFRSGSLVKRLLAARVPVRIGSDKPPGDLTWTKRDDLARQRYLGTLAGQLRDDRVDVLLVSGWMDGVAAGSLAAVPAIIERVDGPSLSTRVRDKSACARVICESESVLRIVRSQLELLRCRPEALALVVKGVDLERFDPARHDHHTAREALGLAGDDIVIGTVTRLAPEKNLGQLLEAFSAVVLAGGLVGRRLRLVICGPDGGERRALVRRAHELGVAEQTVFAGARDDVAPVLAALDVFALTSIYEGTPGALLEAMAMGLPVVATHVGAIPEIVNGNGYLVPPLDAHATAQALGELAADGELRQRLGRRSRALAMGHDIRAAVERWAELIEGAYAATRPRPVPE